MKIMRGFIVSVVSLVVSANIAMANNNKAIEELLKERTNAEFKIITNSKNILKGSSFVIVETPSGERLALLASEEGDFVMPLIDGIANNNAKSELKNALDSVNKYNKDAKDTKVLELFQKYSESILKIPSVKSTKSTIYMVLDTTCPYCLQEIARLDDYLQESNVEVLMVGILGQKAHARAAGFYQELPIAKTRTQKIALLKKVFEINYAPKIGNNELATKMSEATLAAGIQGVPYMIKR